MDAELGGIKVKNGVAVAQLLAKGVVAAHGVDLLSGILGHVGHLVEYLPPALRKVAAGDIQTGHEQVAAGGGLGQVDDLPHIALMHIGPDEQQTALGQAAAAFVHGYRRHIRTGFHGRYRQAAAEIKMRAVRFIHQTQHTGVVRHFYNSTQIAANAVISWVVHQNRNGFGVFGNRFGYLFALHAERYAQALVYLRVNVHRHRAAQHQRVNNAFMHVARQNNFIPAFAGREHHALHRACSAAYH